LRHSERSEPQNCDLKAVQRRHEVPERCCNDLLREIFNYDEFAGNRKGKIQLLKSQAFRSKNDKRAIMQTLHKTTEKRKQRQK
jgi:hypothetical protein